MAIGKIGNHLSSKSLQGYTNKGDKRRRTGVVLKKKMERWWKCCFSNGFSGIGFERLNGWTFVGSSRDCHGWWSSQTCWKMIEV